jgi:hypothetical protein
MAVLVLGCGDSAKFQLTSSGLMTLGGGDLGSSYTIGVESELKFERDSWKKLRTKINKPYALQRIFA